MKTLKTIIAILALSIFTFSCSKDNEDSKQKFPTEDFLEGYLAKSGFFQTSTGTINDQGLELGLEFTPLVNGKITALKIKLPDTNAALSITIWDQETKTPIITETVNYTAINVIKAFDIIDLNLGKNKKYMISIRSADYFYRRKDPQSATTYPITSGNIRIDRFAFGISGGGQTYPLINRDNIYIGDFSFDFEPTE